MRRLPPLTAIEAFMQVARLGSVKAAAEELSLSSPALSRRVQALERFLGRSLFDRTPQAMRLTDSGERLLAAIAPHVSGLTDAIEQLTSASPVLRLRLGVPPLFATQQLFPLLPELRRTHPELHLDIDTAPQALSRLGDGIDVAIILQRDVDPALYSYRLDRNEIFVIGSREQAEGPNALRRPEDLARATIFLHRDLPDAFAAFRSAVGLTSLEPLTTDFYDSGQLMLEAAAQGLGVAVMHESHFRHANDPRLVRLFDVRATSPYSYWFACRPRALEQRPVRLFRDWLLTRFGERERRAAA